MFHNIKSEDGYQLHSIPMDVQDGAWIDTDKHVLSQECPCSPIKVKSSFSDFHGEIFHHYRRGIWYEDRNSCE